MLNTQPGRKEQAKMQIIKQAASLAGQILVFCLEIRQETGHCSMDQHNWGFKTSEGRSENGRVG